MLDENLIHKALANPLRREILAWLKSPAEAFPERHAEFVHGVPVHAIQARSGLAQSTISAHVALLVEAGLLVATRVGQWTLLTRNEDVIGRFAVKVFACL
jgi:DNA-binding transcriptional ArsR family regulator